MIKKLKAVEIAGILLAGILALLVATYPTPEYPRDKVVIAFGDSLTVGYGVPPGKNFVAYLSERIKIPIINAGRSGDTTADALIRLQDDVLDKNPDIVLILLGGNDYLKGYSHEAVRENVQVMVKEIQETGAKVILVSLSRKVAPNFDLVLEKIAWDNEVAAFVPDVLDGIISRKDLRFDDIHPNDRGHEIIAQKILPALAKVLMEK